jgi:pyrroline-5-carboxylate reductase
MTQAKICFIGAGNMTRSIVSGLVTHGYPADLIYATNPSQCKLDAMVADFNIQVSNDNLATAKECDVIVLGVKPQLMQQVCEALQQLDLSDKLVITIAAGITANRYDDYFKQQVPLIRCMPNTPTQIGHGMTGLFAVEGINQQQKQLAETLMLTGGKVMWVDKEAELNLVIALAGSSPAYFFLFVESMIEAGVALGMDETKSRLLAEQAALGAAQMIVNNQDLSPATLRTNVTSKGGTTAEALATFERGDIRGLVKQAMVNCINRADEMAKTF